MSEIGQTLQFYILEKFKAMGEQVYVDVETVRKSNRAL
jgi:hypothetical protein